MSTVILPLFHFKVAQCGIYSQTTAFRRLLWSAAPPPLSRKASNLKWLEYRCQAICIYVHNTRSGNSCQCSLCTSANFYAGGKTSPNKVSTLIIAHTFYTFSWWAGFNLSAAFFATPINLFSQSRVVVVFSCISFCRARCVHYVCHQTAERNLSGCH